MQHNWCEIMKIIDQTCLYGFQSEYFAINEIILIPCMYLKTEEWFINIFLKEISAVKGIYIKVHTLH